MNVDMVTWRTIRHFKTSEKKIFPHENKVIWRKRKGELQSSSTGKFLSSNVKQDTVTLLTCNVRHVSLCYRDVCVDRDGQCDGIKTNIFFVTKL
ncbi:hypothetical protein HOLleu_39362 [Holothuria leucospilota]|uniref:Uncharacterized protein n=1 Tax=Holothuria leucospilota TaxID=206669 RepID=A0A9Q0YGF6_HOLLE|nr:hypothetical protein HOLleu_39362 [Holothuria leucospilota]